MLLNFRLATLGLVCFALACGFASAQETKTEGFGPYSAAEAAKRFELHPDCKIELVACEPDVIDPVHIAFNTDGKLWVVEYTDYPNGPGEGKPGLSRIRVLSDDDGDGRYTNPVTFAEKLLFANGLMFWKDGVIVTTDGKIEFMRDTDNDGKADDRQVWFQGFATKNPQLRHNHPQLAMDCKIYVTNGYRGGDIVPGPDNPWGLNTKAKPVSISGQDFRFDPLNGDYEAIPGMAQFGMSFDNLGNRFVCTNRNPSRQIVLANEQMKLTSGLSIPRHYEDVSPAGEASKLFPISRTWTTSNLHANQFTAACGVTIYLDQQLGSEFQGNSFTCDPTANLVHRDVLTPSGPTFRSKPGRDGIEFLATKDEWFRPVNLSHGPDGSFYVIDMYRAVIEHPQFMPVELRDRPDLLLGTDKGRIWKVKSQNDSFASDLNKNVPLANASLDVLIDALASNSAWQRDHARHLLLEKKAPQVITQIRSRLKKRTIPPAPFLLHFLNRHGQLKLSDLKISLELSDSLPLMNAIVELGSSQFADDPAWINLLNEMLASSAEERLTHSAFTVLGRVPWNALTEENRKRLRSHLSSNALSESQALKKSYDPYWLSTFLGISARNDSLMVLEDFLGANTKGDLALALTPVIHDLARLVARQNQEGQVDALLTSIPSNSKLDSNTELAAFAGLADGYPGGVGALRVRVAKLSGDQQAAVKTLLSEASELYAAEKIAPQLLPIVTTLLSLADDDTSLQQLMTATGSGDATRASLALTALLKRPVAQVNPALLELLPERRGAVRRSILQAMASNESRAKDLLDEIEAGRVPPLEINATVEKTIYRLKDKALKDRARKLLKKEPPADRVKVLADYQVSLTMKSDPLRGKVVFEKNCATCHKIGGVGVDVAPDISDSRTKTPIFLLTNIVDPNRAIDANYFSFNILDTDGRVHTGIVTAETSSSVTLKQPEAKMITIPREEIELFKNNGVSLMPVGLERTINKQQMADLISFIKNWRYLDGLIPKEVIK